MLNANLSFLVDGITEFLSNILSILWLETLVQVYFEQSTGGGPCITNVINLSLCMTKLLLHLFEKSVSILKLNYN